MLPLHTRIADNCQFDIITQIEFGMSPFLKYKTNHINNEKNLFVASRQSDGAGNLC